MLLRRGDRGPAVADLREALASLQLLPSLNGADRTFVEFDAATWDREFEEDVATGRLDALAREALRDDRAGRTTEL